MQENLNKNYINKIGNHELLSREEEYYYALKFKKGEEAKAKLENNDNLTNKEINMLKETVVIGEQSKKILLRTNQRLVISIAKQFPTIRDLGMEDRIQEGNLGLQQALNKFEPKKGFKFSTYATSWIKQSIQKAINNSTLIRIPIDKTEKKNKEMELTTNIGYNNSMSKASLRIHNIQNPSSMDANIKNDNSTYNSDYHSIIPSNTSSDPATIANKIFTEEDYQDFIEKHLHGLEKKCVILHCGFGGIKAKSIKEIAHTLSIKEEIVRRSHKKGIEKIKTALFPKFKTDFHKDLSKTNH